MNNFFLDIFVCRFYFYFFFLADRIFAASRETETEKNMEFDRSHLPTSFTMLILMRFLSFLFRLQISADFYTILLKALDYTHIHTHTMKANRTKKILIQEKDK